MRVPSLSDRVVRVHGWITDKLFGYDHWRAAQFSPEGEGKSCVLVVFDSKEERDAFAAKLEAHLGALPMPDSHP